LSIYRCDLAQAGQQRAPPPQKIIRNIDEVEEAKTIVHWLCEEAQETWLQVSSFLVQLNQRGPLLA
jgi:hypothetical protein